MSLTKFTYHLVFSTKQRKPVIDANIERTVYGILYGLCKDKKAYVRRIGGMADHVHLLVDIPSNISVADFVKYVKENASKTIKYQHLITAWEGWSEGYGGFTVSDTLVPAATAYIQRQKEHHRHTTFREEYISWLKEYPQTIRISQNRTSTHDIMRKRSYHNSPERRHLHSPRQGRGCAKQVSASSEKTQNPPQILDGKG